MYPTQLHSYLLWRSSARPDAQALASRRYTAAISLIPAAMVGLFVFGWRAGMVIALCMGAAFATDSICRRFFFKNSPKHDGVWILTSLLLALMLPPNIAWYWPVIGAIFAIAVGKYKQSVDNMPFLQPAAVGLLALHMIAWSPMMGKDSSGGYRWPILRRAIGTSEGAQEGGMTGWVRDFFKGDVANSTTPDEYLNALYKGDRTITWDATHKPRPIDLVKMNPQRSVGSPASSEAATPAGIPGNEHYTWLSMLLGYIPATIGGSSALALGLGVLFLIFSCGSMREVVNQAMLPFFAFITMFAVLYALALLDGAANAAKISNIPIHLMTGSTIVGVFYFAADPTVAPRSLMGKAYAGVAFGVLESLLRSWAFLPFSEAIFISVVITQGLSYVMDMHLARPADESRNPSGVGLSTSTLGRL